MANPKAAAVVQAALALLTGPPIPYVKGGETLAGMDCQGLVEYCVRACGGQMSYSGSNDMFRNACSWVGTLAEAKAQGKLLPGAVLFILEAVNSDTPQKYRTDGIGDASHIGLYCGDKAAEVVHASGSKGCVLASTLKNGWTHVALLKAVDYGSTTQEVGTMPTPKTEYAIAYAAQGTTVNMRDKPNGDYMLKIPIGTRLPIHAVSSGWSQTTHNGYIGWVKDEFLQAEESDATEDAITPAILEAYLEFRALMDALLGVDD